MKPNIKYQAANQAFCVLRTLRSLYGAAHKVAEQDVLDLVEARLLEHSLRFATKWQAAVHEAGHMVAFEVEGMVASRAEISGTTFGRYGWGGFTRCLEPLSITPKAYHPDDLLREARTALAGALAENMWGEGDIESSPGEQVEAGFLTARAAQMLDRDPLEVLDNTVAATRGIVAMYGSEVLEIADKLFRKRKVYRGDCEKILARVRVPPRGPRIIKLRGLGVSVIAELEGRMT